MGGQTLGSESMGHLLGLALPQPSCPKETGPEWEWGELMEPDEWKGLGPLERRILPWREGSFLTGQGDAGYRPCRGCRACKRPSFGSPWALWWGPPSQSMVIGEQ